MLFKKLNSSIQGNLRQVIKTLNKLSFSTRILSLNASKAIISNNKRKMNGKPMIRKQAYIRNYNNKCKRSQCRIYKGKIYGNNCIFSRSCIWSNVCNFLGTVQSAEG